MPGQTDDAHGACPNRWRPRRQAKLILARTAPAQIKAHTVPGQTDGAHAARPDCTETPVQTEGVHATRLNRCCPRRQTKQKSSNGVRPNCRHPPNSARPNCQCPRRQLKLLVPNGARPKPIALTAPVQTDRASETGIATADAKGTSTNRWFPRRHTKLLVSTALKRCWCPRHRDEPPEPTPASRTVGAHEITLSCR